MYAGERDRRYSDVKSDSIWVALGPPIRLSYMLDISCHPLNRRASSLTKYTRRADYFYKYDQLG